MICFFFVLQSTVREFKDPGSSEFSLGPGVYIFECWGAQGGHGYDGKNQFSFGGKGAYATGTIEITKITKFQATVGGKGGSGPTKGASGGKNGGGNAGGNSGSSNSGSGGGGGASDIRIGAFLSSDRIIVAAGGSGGAGYCDGAPGGAETNFKASSNNNFVKGSLTQNSGGDLKGNGGPGLTDLGSIQGSGGGGGWRGGPASGKAGGVTVESWKSVGESGNSYVSRTWFSNGKLVDGRDQILGREGNGMIKITQNFACPEGCSECTSATQCTKCISGQFLDGDKCVSSCPTGKYGTNGKCEPCTSPCQTCTGTATTCTSCVSGKYLNGKECVSSCPDGKYSSEANECMDCTSACKTCSGPSTNQCTHCNDGYFLEDSSCRTQCSAGSYANSLTNKCDQCQKGYYSNEGSTECEQCEKGSVSGAGSSFCTKCTGNSYAVLDKCIECSGEGNGVDADHAKCGKCAAGSYGNAGVCQECPVGHFSDNPGSSSCEQCGGNTYAPNSGATKCLPCDGSTGNGVDAERTKCGACLAGSFSSNGICSPCSAGSITNTSGNTKCSLCNDNTVAETAGLTKCTPCGSGMWPNSEHTQCQKQPTCTVGQQLIGLSCVNCSPGHTSSDDFGSCIPCNKGYYSPTAGSDCLECDAGQYADGIGQTACKVCQKKNEYSSGGAGSCSECTGIGKGTNLEHNKCELCPEGTYAKDGFCEDCKAGTYNNQAGQTICLDCLGNTVSTKGSHRCEPCAPGKYTNADHTQCVDQQQCADGQIQDGIGCKKCPGGQTSDENHAKCIECPPGTYSPYEGSTCKPCEPGTVSEGSAIKCTICTGNYYTNKDKSKCVECSTPGYAVDIFHSSCDPCKAGEYSSDGICQKCPTGHFSENPGSPSCEQCDNNTFSKDVGAENCIICQGTHKGVNVNHTSCDECESNQFGNNGICSSCSTNCVSCNSKEICLNCSSSTFLHSSKCFEKCPAGYYGEETKRICEKCKEECQNCESETKCTSCVSGFYLYEADWGCINQSECENITVMNKHYGIKEEGRKCIVTRTDSFTNFDFEENPYENLLLIAVIGGIFAVQMDIEFLTELTRKEE